MSWARLFSKPLIPALLIFIFSCLLYSNTINHDFVWDDRELIIENPKIRSLDSTTLREIFFKNFWEKKKRIGGYYRPLVLLSYNVNYRIFGMNPRGFHLTNIVANAAVCLFVFLFVFLLFKNLLLAFLTALIFAAIPLHTESVAWISGRTDVFCTAWMFVSLILYVLARKKLSLVLLACSLLAFLPALLAKEIAVSLPLIVIVLDYAFFSGIFCRTSRSGEQKKRLRALAANVIAFAPLYYMLMVACYFLLRNFSSGTDMSIYHSYAQGPVNTIALALSILSGYTLKLLVPFRLNAEYDAPVPDSLLDPHALAGLLIFAAILYGAYRYRKKKAYMLSAAFFFFGLAPVLNIVPLGEISAERFLYFPSFGFALALGAIFTEAFAKRSVYARVWNSYDGGQPPARTAAKGGASGRGAYLVIIFAVILAAYSVRTVTRNADWRNEETLFAQTAQAAEGSARAHLNLANAHIRGGRLREAIPELEKALAIDPDYVDALGNLGGVYKRLGQSSKAVQLIKKALQLAPTSAELHNNLGTIHVEMKQFNEAEAEFQKAIRYNPNYSEAQFNLALIQLKKGDMDSARRYFEEVKDLGNRFEMAYYYIGIISAAKGENDYAKRHLEHFLAIHKRDDGYRARAQATYERLRAATQPPAP